MSTKFKTILLLGSLLMADACSTSTFSGSGSGPSRSAPAAGDPNSPDSPGDAATPGGTSDQPQDCTSGDKVNFNWTGDAKKCLDEGKTFNFDSMQCAEMRKAQFECNWANVKDALTKLKLLTPVLSADSDAGAKLVSCGQSEDGNRIVVQWLKAPDTGKIDCNVDPVKDGVLIMTGCYTHYIGQEPPPPANDEEKRKRTYDCMNQL